MTGYLFTLQHLAAKEPDNRSGIWQRPRQQRAFWVKAQTEVNSLTCLFYYKSTNVINEVIIWSFDSDLGGRSK